MAAARRRAAGSQAAAQRRKVVQSGGGRVHLLALHWRAASMTLNEIMVLLYMMTEWLDWMNPMPPMSAARLNTWLQPSTTRLQLSNRRRSTRWNSWQKTSSCGQAGGRGGMRRQGGAEGEASR